MRLCEEILVVVVVIASALVAVSSAAMDSSCLSCLAKVEGGPNGCNMDAGSLSCGLYQIKEPYWIDCGKPGGSWRACATDKSCAEGCIRSYMNRYERICKRQLGKSSLSCYDMGRLHNGGPYGCSNSNTDRYVSKMKSYC